jgi:hypothetical protein
VESFNHQGITYRTKLISGQQAESFARALTAHPSFIEVQVEQSPRAKGEKRFYVRYKPTSARCQEAMKDRQQSAREERAKAQLFTFVRDESGRYHHCLSHQTGNVYEVTTCSCSCEDKVYRAGPAGLRCKHELALQFALLSEERIGVF